MVHNKPRLSRVERVGRAFSRAALKYDQASQVQRESADWLLAGLLWESGGQDLINLDQGCSNQALPNQAESNRVLDLGCGTGLMGERLSGKVPSLEIIGLDCSLIMLKQARQRGKYSLLVQGDAGQLPFGSREFDLICANMSFQWFENPLYVLRQCHNLLREGGKLMLTVPLPGTLKEIEQAWRAAGSTARHVNDFLGVQAWQDLIHQAGFECELEACTKVFKYPSAREAVASIKSVGANQLVGQTSARKIVGRSVGLSGKTRYRAMLETYEMTRDKQGVPLSYSLLRAKLVRA